jgi:hypothetical protein
MSACPPTSPLKRLPLFRARLLLTGHSLAGAPHLQASAVGSGADGRAVWGHLFLPSANGRHEGLQREGVGNDLHHHRHGHLRDEVGRSSGSEARGYHDYDETRKRGRGQDPRPQIHRLLTARPREVRRAATGSRHDDWVREGASVGATCRHAVRYYVPNAVCLRHRMGVLPHREKPAPSRLTE